MFTFYKCSRLFSERIPIGNKLISCYYFSATSELFVKKVRNLEKLKHEDSISPSLYENGKYILFHKSDSICLDKDDKLIYKEYKDIHDLKRYGDFQTVLLDILSESESESDNFLFALDLDVSIETDVEQIEANVDGKFVNVRHSMYLLGQKESTFVNHARGLLNFCKTHNYCTFCGALLRTKEGGYQKQCTNCKVTHYPTIAPIGLTLIEDENHEEVLLVRQKRHPPGMYTCVAGFIEPGESLEENVKREVAEELGIHLKTCEFCTSQHWALPACQLILGCIGTSLHRTPDKDVREIQDVKWVKAEELKEAVDRTRKLKRLNDMNEKKLWSPPRNSVSHYLMVAWLKKYHNYEPTS